MKALVCEKCGSSDFIKEGGMLVCPYCQTKYSPEEAKRRMAEGTVEVTGTVKIDHSDKLSNLYQIARRAKDDNNGENAAKYYDLVLQEDPNSWEASFYIVYFKAMGCTVAQILEAANNVMNCLNTVLKMIQAHVPDQAEQSKAYTEVATRLKTVATMLYAAAVNHYLGINTNIRSNYTQELINNTLACCNILYIFGNRLESIFGSRKDAQQLAARAWIQAIDMHKEVIRYIANKNDQKATIESYTAKIQKYDPSYTMPVIKTSGCYIATAVYGSYDCPQVWTLRRYRDDILAANCGGRMFIRIYYALSPAMVRHFGHTAWFQRLWRGVLNRMVAKLRARGFADTPYWDQT